MVHMFHFTLILWYSLNILKLFINVHILPIIRHDQLKHKPPMDLFKLLVMSLDFQFGMSVFSGSMCLMCMVFHS
jgi:hypothetical protein